MLSAHKKRIVQFQPMTSLQESIEALRVDTSSHPTPYSENHDLQENECVVDQQLIETQRHTSLQSPAKYKTMVQHLVQYTSVLADIAREQKQIQALQLSQMHEGKVPEVSLNGFLVKLRQLEDSLACFCPPSASGLDSDRCHSLSATIACATSTSSPSSLLANHSKHSYLLSTLSDLKRQVLLAGGGSGRGGTLKAFPPSLCPVTFPLIGEGREGEEDGVDEGGCSEVPLAWCGDSHAITEEQRTSLLCSTNESNSATREEDEECDEDEEDEESVEHGSSAHTSRFGRGKGKGRERGGGGKGCSRKVTRLNKSCTTLLTSWLLEHLQCPCPSPQEKMELATALRLEPAQVGNWMTNMRKRHVYPVLAGKKHPKSALEMAILERHKQATPFLSESHAGTNADSGDSDIDICAARCSRTEAASTVKNEGNRKGRNSNPIASPVSPVLFDDRTITTSSSSSSGSEFFDAMQEGRKKEKGGEGGLNIRFELDHALSLGPGQPRKRKGQRMANSSNSDHCWGSHGGGGDIDRGDKRRRDWTVTSSYAENENVMYRVERSMQQEQFKMYNHIKYLRGGVEERQQEQQERERQEQALAWQAWHVLSQGGGGGGGLGQELSGTEEHLEDTGLQNYDRVSSSNYDFSGNNYNDDNSICSIHNSCAVFVTEEEDAEFRQLCASKCWLFPLEDATTTSATSATVDTADTNDIDGEGYDP